MLTLPQLLMLKTEPKTIAWGHLGLASMYRAKLLFAHVRRLCQRVIISLMNTRDNRARIWSIGMQIRCTQCRMLMVVQRLALRLDMRLQCNWITMCVLRSLSCRNTIVRSALMFRSMSGILTWTMIISLAMIHTLAVAMRVCMLWGDACIKSWGRCIAHWSLHWRSVLCVSLHWIVHEIVLLRVRYLISTVSRCW